MTLSSAFQEKALNKTWITSCVIRITSSDLHLDVFDNNNCNTGKNNISKQRHLLDIYEKRGILRYSNNR